MAHLISAKWSSSVLTASLLLASLPVLGAGIGAPVKADITPAEGPPTPVEGLQVVGGAAFGCPISSNFNGTAMAAGNYIWFNSVLTPNYRSSNPVTVSFTGSTITFVANSTTYTVSAPDALITFSPSATLATTTFDAPNNRWVTVVPASGLAGKTFLDGVAFQVPAGGLPGGIHSVTWQGAFSSNAPVTSIEWQWGAAVYNSFGADYNTLGVKPVDDNKASIYKNSDHAGTPESFKTHVIGGATGGGGSNFTGSYSGTKSCGSSVCNILNDPANCESCGHVCPAGAACSAGVCTCLPGEVVCGATCTDINIDPDNCGACGNVCPAGYSCTDGVCTPPCPPGEVLCGGVCTNTANDPNNCGNCGHVCPAGYSCADSTCIPPAVSGSCLPTSSMSVLIQGAAPTATITAYVPHGSWSEPATGVQRVPVQPLGASSSIATANTVNSCSSDSATGLTVCTANNPDVYLIPAGPSPTVTTLTSGNDGTFLSYSGGSCQDCGVAIDAGAGTMGKAIIALGFGGTGALQFLDLATNTFDPPFSLGMTPSEDISVDPIRHLVISPNETPNKVYQVVKTTPSNALFNSPAIPTSGEPDSAGEDCSTGIILSTLEFTGDLFLADLGTPACTSFVPGAPGSWTAPSQVQSFPEFVGLSAGTSGIAIAPGSSHLGIVTGEFGGSLFGAIKLPSASSATCAAPAVLDWVAADVPNDPSGAVWNLGLDPHTVTAFTNPNNGRAYALVSNLSRTYLAVIDLDNLLNTGIVPRTLGTHFAAGPLPTCPTPAPGCVVSFVAQ